MIFVLKLICTWMLLAASCSAVWWSFKNEKLINISWLAFLLPAIGQFVFAFRMGPSKVKSFIVFGCINLVLAGIVGLGVWYLIQIANAYRNGR